jgi:hypothetical protein
MEPTALVQTRKALHALAEQVVSPLRAAATGGRIGLVARPGGFGTPDLPGGGWAGVSGTDVVAADADGGERRAPITSLRAAAEHLGLDADLPDDPLTIDADAAATLAAAWARGDAALRALVAQAAQGDEPSAIQLWPEHFDIAVELGSPDARATYGLSPGDDEHPEPYAYVGPWAVPPPGPAWNAQGFTGAEAPAEEEARVLAFWRDRSALLGSYG